MEPHHSKAEFSKELLPPDDVFEHDPFVSATALATDDARTLSGAECVMHYDMVATPSIQTSGGGRDWFSERRLSAGAEEDEDNDFDNVCPVASTAANCEPSTEKILCGKQAAGSAKPLIRDEAQGPTRMKPKAKQEFDLQELSKAARDILPFAFSDSNRRRSAGTSDDGTQTPVSMDAWDTYPLKALLSSVSEKLQKHRRGSTSRSRTESFFCGRLSDTYNGFATPSSRSAYEPKSQDRSAKIASGRSSSAQSEVVGEASAERGAQKNAATCNTSTPKAPTDKSSYGVTKTSSGEVPNLIPYKQDSSGKLQPIALPLTPPVVAVSANIEKFSPSFARGWQWRFFELREANAELVYWEDETLAETELPRGRIYLRTVSRIYANTGTTIILNVPGRDYRLRFISPGQKDAWLDVLDVAIYNSKFHQSPNPTPASTPPTPTPTPVAPTPPNRVTNPKLPAHGSNRPSVASPFVPSPILDPPPTAAATCTDTPPTAAATTNTPPTATVTCTDTPTSAAATYALELPRGDVSASRMASWKRDSVASLASWSSFVEDWVVRPLKITGSKAEHSAFCLQELTMKKSFLIAKDLMHPLKVIWRDSANKGSIVDMRRYVPNLPDADSNKLTQLAEFCASAAPGEPQNQMTRLWASFLNVFCDDMIPECLPQRYRAAVAWLQLIKGHPSPDEECLNNVLAGYLKFGRQHEGLSDVEMKTYFGLMICSRPVANGKVQDCRNANLSFSSLKLGSKAILLDHLYLFDCSFSDSLPLETIDLQHCWEIKRVKETSREFEWSVKEPPDNCAVRFSCTTYRDASQWRMAQVMAKLSSHSEKERGLVLRHLYNSSPAAY